MFDVVFISSIDVSASSDFIHTPECEKFKMRSTCAHPLMGCVMRPNDDRPLITGTCCDEATNLLSQLIFSKWQFARP